MTDSSRRAFIAGASAFGALTSLGLSPRAASRPQTPAAPPHRLLVLGGTQYVGAAIVDAARARGHDVTLFNRGLTNPHLFSDLTRLRGDRFPDRGSGVAALAGQEFDAIIDVSGYFPVQVRATTDLLKSSGRYVFISSIAVYEDFQVVGLREDARLRTLADEHDERELGATYGGRKAACERIVSDAFPGRSTALRMHAICGPYDPGDSLRYWAIRCARGGDVLAPGSGRDPVQLVDVRDVARFAVDSAEGRHSGTFNIVGPREPLTMAALVEACRRVGGRDARMHWIDEAFLREQRVASWGDMPLWAPLSEDRGFTQIDGTRSLQAGFSPRPLEDTIRGVLETTRLPIGYEFGASGGLPTAREQAVLEAWRKRA